MPDTTDQTPIAKDATTEFPITLTPTLTVNIYSITSPYYFRIQAAPITGRIPKPELPEGYSHDQAFENVDSYRDAYEKHMRANLVARALTILGACWRHTIEQGGITAEQLEAIDARCKATFLPPHSTLTELYDIGDSLTSLHYDATDGQMFELAEFINWIEFVAVGVDARLIAEMFRILRANRQRYANRRSGRVAATSSETQVSEETKNSWDADVRPGESSKVLGNHRPDKPARSKSRSKGVNPRNRKG